MDPLKTPFARHPWLVMLVALPDALARQCTAAVVPTPIVRVTDATAALERIPLLKPLVVVIGETPEADVRRLRAAAKEALTSLVELATDDGRPLDARLRAALEESEAARALSSRS